MLGWLIVGFCAFIAAVDAAFILLGSVSAMSGGYWDPNVPTFPEVVLLTGGIGLPLLMRRSARSAVGISVGFGIAMIAYGLIARSTGIAGSEIGEWDGNLIWGSGMPWQPYVLIGTAILSLTALRLAGWSEPDQPGMDHL
ncbi:MAG: hypothetical protein WBM72_04295 [Actinomycetota bacterium]